MTNTIIEAIIENELINSSCEELEIYYSITDKCFYALNEEEAEEDEDNLIKAPCVYHYQSSIWKRFREMLTEEERIIADSYPYRRGYFNYLHEEGLIDTYYEAKESVARDVCAHWLKVNNLNLTLNNITLA